MDAPSTIEPRTLAAASAPGSLRIASLDGLRALAIALVLASHLVSVETAARLAMLGDVGNLGVRVFFVISGFLITSLLIEEHERTGQISVPMFYLWRTFRIFPAYTLPMTILPTNSLY